MASLVDYFKTPAARSTVPGTFSSPSAGTVSSQSLRTGSFYNPAGGVSHDNNNNVDMREGGMTHAGLASFINQLQAKPKPAAAALFHPAALPKVPTTVGNGILPALKKYLAGPVPITPEQEIQWTQRRRQVDDALAMALAQQTRGTKAAKSTLASSIKKANRSGRQGEEASVYGLGGVGLALSPMQAHAGLQHVANVTAAARAQAQSDFANQQASLGNSVTDARSQRTSLIDQINSERAALESAHDQLMKGVKF